MIDEIVYPEYMMCPEVNSMKILGGEMSEINFNLNIAPKTQQAYINAECAVVYTADITRYFNAEEYVKNGEMDYITLS